MNVTDKYIERVQELNPGIQEVKVYCDTRLDRLERFKVMYFSFEGTEYVAFETSTEYEMIFIFTVNHCDDFVEPGEFVAAQRGLIDDESILDYLS